MRFILLCAISAAVGGVAGAAERVDFAHDVLPLLKAHCAECHTDGEYKGGLSFDTREALLDSGVVEVGNSGSSDLIERLTTDDADLRMPLEQDALTPEQIAVFRDWVDQDLPWEDGFTFLTSTYQAPLAPRHPTVPPAQPGCTNPIDRILRAYLLEHEVTLEPVSDATFARRVSLDLVGLLPAPAKREEFLADDQGTRRDLFVQELLSNKQAYAEHWLTFWNDLLRNDYAGIGYIDGGRKQITGWLYQSLVDNLPYDAFVRQLISPSPDAEGFLNGIKWRGRVNASQTREIQFSQNISQIFLGINMKCASCHDSFINNWKLADAYGLAAITATEPLELHRCDKPTGQMATAKFLYPELGKIDPEAPREQRLQQLATLLTHVENGRFTRTIVNRIWQRLMGRGIVEPVDDMDSQPWNADLLDYLAIHLVENGYDLKKTIELIVDSQAYQSHCEITTESNKSADEFVFRGPISRRMTAEQFLDAIWRITETSPEQPAAEFGDRGKEPVRASLVTADLLMRSLGRPNREQVVTTRPPVLGTLQSLDLSNGDRFHTLLVEGAEHLLANWENQTDPLIQHLFLFSFCRVPDTNEMETCHAIVGDTPNAESLSDLLWVLFMTPEFQLVR